MDCPKIKKLTQHTPNNWEISIARSLNEIEAIRPIWEKMQQNENSPKPNVILLHNNSQPQTMLIGRIENIRVPCKLGYKNLFNPSLRCIAVVYGGIIGQLNPDVSALLIQTLINSLKRGDADTVFFNGLKTDSAICNAIKNHAGFLCREHFTKQSPHYRMTIPPSMEQFYQSCSKKHRANLKRYIRKLENEFQDQVKVITYSKEEQLEQAIKAAAQISSKTYQHALDSGLVDSHRTRSLLSSAAKSNWLQAHVMYIADQPCSFQIGLKYGSAYFLDKIGFDPQWEKFEVGTVLFLKVLEGLCNNNTTRWLDFGFGDAAYKQKYGNVSWPESSIYIFAPRLYPILLNLALTSTSAASSALNYLVTKAGVYNWVKRHWRALLRKRAAPANNQEVN
jgi:hypothetical protein